MNNAVSSPSERLSSERLSAERVPEPALRDTLVELWENLSKLMRQEIALAKAELGEKAQRVKAELIGSAVGAALLHAGLLAFVAALILLLTNVMPAWVAAAVTGLMAAVAGYALLARQRPSLQDLKPERTLENLQKDVRTIKEAGK